MKLLTSCTKNVHFTLNNEIYVQNHGIVMGSPLGPILANVYIYGGIRKHIGSQIAWTCQEMETFCRWHLCLLEMSLLIMS